MPFSHTTGTYNVYSTLVAWLAGKLTTNLPPTVSTLRLNLDHPEQALVPPEWSVHFTNWDTPGAVMGKYPGTWHTGMMEVNCWVSRKAVNWRAQLMQMTDAVMQAIASTSAIVIKDFYTSATTPLNTDYKIDIDRAEEVGHMPDLNPDIERSRIIIVFRWVERP